MELELRQSLSTKLGCVLSIADQQSAVTREFFGVTFKYIFVNSFDLNVPKLVAIMEKGMSCKVFPWKHSQYGND